MVLAHAVKFEDCNMNIEDLLAFVEDEQDDEVITNDESAHIPTCFDFLEMYVHYYAVSKRTQYEDISEYEVLEQQILEAGRLLQVTALDYRSVQFQGSVLAAAIFDHYETEIFTGYTKQKLVHAGHYIDHISSLLVATLADDDMSGLQDYPIYFLLQGEISSSFTEIVYGNIKSDLFSGGSRSASTS
ncbi:hypothetical protein HDU76_007035 [Blyttiomyces sp. JEL0837]|nr:hypothetical protein HDU76_007035 [Blyttiomyces sp. JEL0837]